MRPDSYQYPDFDMNLMTSMARETQLFFDSVVREDRPILDLLTADYTFVDDRLARHYGLPNVPGNRFRRVKVTDDNRRGLLGQASILTLDVVRQSHIARPARQVGDGRAVGHATTASACQRAALAREHRGREAPAGARSPRGAPPEPTCAACHRMMDPIGYSLENFDVVGLWRAKDSGVPIDASGTLVDAPR